ncbi:MAG: amidohydrolase family protein, partial [Deltaproteobacteria bacterium]|nr:amidohydrolase family protein [Deltaproteobacteria bacterium]
MLTAFAIAAFAADQPQPAADWIGINANIYTMNAARPRAEALALLNGDLLAVGSNADALLRRGPQTKVEDLAGRTLVPGLIDTHGHMSGLGSFALGVLDLGDAKSFDDVVQRVRERVKTAKPGEWILGGRWDHESWPNHQLPTHAALSAISPDNPVWLRRVDGHAGLANEAAMKRAGVLREAANPPGGEIIRDARGEPTGVFIDNALSLIGGKIDQRVAETIDMLRKAQEQCLALGLTGVHDPGVSPADVAAYMTLRDAGELKLRIYVMINGSQAQTYFADHPPLVGERLTVRAAKLYADGAMGSRGAWMLAPYADRPTDD